MDPGNWATDLGGGSRFGYTLLSVVLLSSPVAIFLQALSVKLGIAKGRDLAQACREHYSRRPDCDGRIHPHQSEAVVAAAVIALDGLLLVLILR